MSNREKVGVSTVTMAGILIVGVAAISVARVGSERMASPGDQRPSSSDKDRANGRHSADSIESIALADVLSSFVFVAEHRCTEESAGSHGQAAKALPASFSGGACYVFHIPASFSQPLHVYLREQFEQRNIAVLSAPKSPADFVFLVSGGPLFTIKFQVNGRTATIGTQQHVDQLAAMDGASQAVRQEDLILRFE